MVPVELMAPVVLMAPVEVQAQAQAEVLVQEAAQELAQEGGAGSGGGAGCGAGSGKGRLNGSWLRRSRLGRCCRQWWRWCGGWCGRWWCWRLLGQLGRFCSRLCFCRCWLCWLRRRLRLLEELLQLLQLEQRFEVFCTLLCLSRTGCHGHQSCLLSPRNEICLNLESSNPPPNANIPRP